MIKIINNIYPEKLINFYNEHKNFSQDKIVDFNEAYWNQNIAFFEINFDFKEEVFLEECKKINHLFVNHRSSDDDSGYSHKGWSSITLHGISADKTQHFTEYGYLSLKDANYKWTEICDIVPNISYFLKNLPYNFFDRVRIMRLAPHGYIMPHSDNKDRTFGPLNIAINNPNKCHFVFENIGIVPFYSKKGFILDVGRKHMVINMSNEYRYHIIVHGAYKQELFK